MNISEEVKNIKDLYYEYRREIMFECRNIASNIVVEGEKSPRGCTIDLHKPICKNCIVRNICAWEWKDS